MAQSRYVLLDVFTDEPLTGNQLAVFTDARGLAEERLQPIAREMNLSETAFMLPSQGEGDARLRIFTPRAELPFAGHPVVGAAWVYGRATSLGRIVFETGAGLISVELERAGDRLSRATMTQPRPTFSEADDAVELLGALGLGESVGAPVLADNGVRSALVEVASLDILAGLEPDLGRVGRYAAAQTVAVYALHRGDVRVRVFAPAVGVAEDPATGSACGPIGARLSSQGKVPAGPMTIHQGVELGRPSEVTVEITPDGDVLVGGSCVVVGRGFLEL
jgi:trans-2,3-dihydro-3-hydroxyanthranilate isomerase